MMATSNDDSPSQVVAMPVAGSPAAAPGSEAPQANSGPPAASTARDFLKTLDAAVGRLVTLKIVTVVGPVSVGGSGRDTVVAASPGAPVEAASTEVNLLDGHILNVFSTGFAGAGDLQAFHQSQVEKSSAIMMGNLAELQRLASALAAARR